MGETATERNGDAALDPRSLDDVIDDAAARHHPEAEWRAAVLDELRAIRLLLESAGTEYDRLSRLAGPMLAQLGPVLGAVAQTRTIRRNMPDG